MTAGRAAARPVQVAAGRLVLRPPCCGIPIMLARETTDLQLIHEVACQPCQRHWRVTFLADPRHGLHVCWQPARMRP
ncbi:MAG: hypothetical protein ACRDRP_24380 [Pseudonocardiaceae bacterium]